MLRRKGRETSVEDLSQPVSTQPGPVHRSLQTQAAPHRVPLSAYGFCALPERFLLLSGAECLVFHGAERKLGGFMQALQEHKFSFTQTDIVTAHGKMRVESEKRLLSLF